MAGKFKCENMAGYHLNKKCSMDFNKPIDHSKYLDRCFDCCIAGVRAHYGKTSWEQARVEIYLMNKAEKEK